MTGLADCNNFFVSCERSVNPSLEGKAVVVLSNNDGCVIARSNEAKQAGVKMGQPAFEIRDSIRAGDIIALSGNHILYHDISIAVHDIFRRFVPETLDYSVDEAFLLMQGIPSEELLPIGNAIVETCQKEAGIPVTIGFAPTKTLAKIVTETSKKKCKNVELLIDDLDRMKLLREMPISDLWGVGRRLAKKMYQWGVHTVADFADRDILWVRKMLGVTGERSWRELHCQPCIELTHIGRSLQDSVSESRTFPHDVSDYDYICVRIAKYAADCARNLRRMKGKARRVNVFLRTNRFHLDKGYFAPQGFFDFPEPVSDTSSIVDASLRILSSIYHKGIGYKRGGVVLSDIMADEVTTPSLFDPYPAGTGHRKALKTLMHAVDNINEGVGAPKLCLASQLDNGKQCKSDGYTSSFHAPRK